MCMFLAMWLKAAAIWAVLQRTQLPAPAGLSLLLGNVLKVSWLCCHSDKEAGAEEELAHVRPHPFDGLAGVGAAYVDEPLPGVVWVEAAKICFSEVGVVRPRWFRGSCRHRRCMHTHTGSCQGPQAWPRYLLQLCTRCCMVACAV